MKVQEWLRNNGGNLDLLEEQLGIKANCHEDGRVILNYSQIDSPKNNEIVRECRGLVLNAFDNWSLVACAFTRFFNIGEFPEDFKKFNWNDCIGTHKEDGSIILIYWFKGQLCINTRNSFGDGEINYSGLTWRDLVFQAYPERELIYLMENFKNGYTFICELCSPYNKIVRSYPNPVLYLLAVNQYGHEFYGKEVHKWTKKGEFLYPEYRNFRSIQQVEDYIRREVNADRTFEGIVLNDGVSRWKIKTPEYLALHRMANNGDPSHPKNLLPFILSGELDELYSYFPEVEPYVVQMNAYIAKQWQDIDNHWYVWRNEPSQKKFAQGIERSKHTGILFSARKLGVEPAELFVTLEYLTKMFKGFKYSE